ncbi:MAG: AbrB/MazE/SpoVT family DNA-binding domain-containing protein [Oscillospiraceae bacterium]|nr:AbrB/MazE/SpoVT family DNA-binding domain-containing protein [Oscillospiraceae bacterium]
MDTAKIFENGRSQAVRLPKKFRFSDEEVVVQRLGEAVILIPKTAVWQTFLDGLNSFTDDVFQNGREAEITTTRDTL